MRTKGKTYIYSTPEENAGWTPSPELVEKVRKELADSRRCRCDERGVHCGIHTPFEGPRPLDERMGTDSKALCTEAKALAYEMRRRPGQW